MKEIPLPECRRISDKQEIVLRKLGSGSFGQVYKGRYRDTMHERWEQVAVKFFHSRRHMLEESEIMVQLKNKHSTYVHSQLTKTAYPKLLQTIDMKPVLCLVYDFIGGQCMADFFQKKPPQQDPYPILYLKVFLEFSLVISHLHGVCKFRHRDIKRDNVMVELDTTTGNIQVVPPPPPPLPPPPFTLLLFCPP